MKAKLLGAAAAALVGIGFTTQAYPNYEAFIYSDGSYTILSGLPSGAIPDGINDAGQIVGYFAQGSGQGTGGFLYSGGTYTTLDGIANGINNSGQIVGYSPTIGGFLYSNATYTPLKSGYIPGGINNEGQIVGYNINNQEGFIYRGGSYTNLQLFTYAHGINDAGQIVGIPSFLYSNGTYSTLLYDGYGINDAGQIVGTNGNVGFLYSGGIYTILYGPVPGHSVPTYAFGINNFGQVVGAVSVPELSTWAMLLFGFGGLGAASLVSTGRNSTPADSTAIRIA